MALLNNTIFLQKYSQIQKNSSKKGYQRQTTVKYMQCA